MKKIDTSKLIVYDIETLINCIIVCCKDVKTGNKKSFVLYNNDKYQDSAVELFVFLRKCVKQGYSFIGYNNLGFDAQVLTYFYNWCNEEIDPLYQMNVEYIINVLFNKAQELIADHDSFEIRLPERKLFAQQIDLFKQKHYDSLAKATSLKWLQFSMNYANIEEMPIDHETYIDENDINVVLEYCWNDVDSTFEFYKRISYETDLRIEMSNQFKVNLINASEPKMVRDIFATFITKEMNISYAELKKLKTVRENVNFKDIIFDYVNFQTPFFKDLLTEMKQISVVTSPNYVKPSKAEIKNGAIDKSAFTKDFTYHNIPITIGLGGIHACLGSGVYEPDENEIIEDADGTSFYPMMAIKNNLKPAHLGRAFSTTYPMMFEERMKYPKKDPRNYIFKIILNSAYGLSKEINSYLYDPLFTYSITINGQLMLLMLAEALSLSVPDIVFLQMNTDGLTYKYNKKYTPIVRKICTWWEQLTKINLEYAYYKKMIFRDVNSYIAIDTKDGVKKKGIFETESDYHKNPSNLIVTKALEQYFVNNKNYEEYIRRKDACIFDYCIGVKKKKNFDLNLYVKKGVISFIESQQKVARIFVSADSGGYLFKDFHDGRKVSVLSDVKVTQLNNIDSKDAKDYSINYDWYIQQTKDIIETIEGTNENKEEKDY